jgi:hypothetical protein
MEPSSRRTHCMTPVVAILVSDSVLDRQRETGKRVTAACPPHTSTFRGTPVSHLACPRSCRDSACALELTAHCTARGGAIPPTAWHNRPSGWPQDAPDLRRHTDRPRQVPGHHPAVSSDGKHPRYQPHLKPALAGRNARCRRSYHLARSARRRLAAWSDRTHPRSLTGRGRQLLRFQIWPLFLSERILATEAVVCSKGVRRKGRNAH